LALIILIVTNWIISKNPLKTFKWLFRKNKLKSELERNIADEYVKNNPPPVISVAVENE